MKKLILVFSVLGVLISSCKVQYVPIETGTTVHVKDSTIYNYIDSVRIHDATRYKDMAWLGDTLSIEGQRSRMWAVADTTKEVLLGGLEEDKVEEHTKVIYKDRIQYKDSLVYKEVPVPVEVEKKVTPKLYPWSLALNLFFILISFGLIYMKVKGISLKGK